MSILNVPTCTTDRGNTGTPACYFDIKHIKSVILAPATQSFSAANMADVDTFIAAMQAATIAGTSARIYPVSNFVGVTDNTEEAVFETSGYGDKRFTREGDYQFKFEFWKGGMCLNKQLRKFNKGSWSVYLVDAQNQVWGKKVGTALAGFSASIYTEKPKINDGTAATKYMIDLSLPNPEELADDFGVVVLDCSFDDFVKGILNVNITVTVSTEADVTYTIATECGNDDLYDFYADELADTDAIILKNNSGTPVVASAVVKVPASKAWKASATLTAGTYTIELPTPAALAALDIGEAPANGIESDVVTFVTSS